MNEPLPSSLVTSPPSADPTVGNTIEPGADAKQKKDRPRGLLSDAWRDLRRKPLFWISAGLILLFLVMAAAPSLFTSASATEGVLARSRVGPSADAWFGYDVQGRDVFARAIYGARASIVVSLASTLGTVLFGGMMGVIAGYRGGWLDGLVSRLGEVFSGIPFVLGAIVILFTFNGPGSNRGPWAIMGIVVVSLVVLTWPVSMRIMRSSVLAVRDADYIVAARAMGAGPGRIIFKHLIPNCLAPLLVYSTILIGSFVGAEATLSFLGVGLRTPVVSWGIMINEAQNYIRVSPYLLFFPSAFLVTAVLAFVMLGEAVREALDPKLR
ncbi:peptide ABC transporter permease [Actinoplanes sp. NBRC 14428]|uniref:Oligopeptide transport system permease protein n=1 Tax=Pseudosporangium ferrugineum TaxID=439699 RepID=A0A2T0S3Y8_9ACTN|nr:ABC transporter permease [Pseudosporangium ferrugineum]PRY28140.1 oligopeptide transport system permease protein [Pseudosporangium ferrugineum]BCJ52267.1 peptide ABC transporter permease [Actinoplanes sp. NBRC 14428]